MPAVHINYVSTSQMEQQLVEELSKANITVLSSSHFGTNQDPALVQGVFVSHAV